MDYSDKLMSEAFIEAAKALKIGEVPIGAIFYNYQTKQIVARAGNSVNKSKNATSEIILSYCGCIVTC